MQSIGKLSRKTNKSLNDNFLVTLLNNMHLTFMQYKDCIIFLHFDGFFSSTHLLFLCNYLTGIGLQFVGLRFSLAIKYLK
jgi:hypothetical protein